MPSPQQALLASVLTSTEVPAETVSVQTALLILVAGLLVFVAAKVSAVHRRLDQLDQEAERKELLARARAASPVPVGASEMAPQVLAAITAAVHVTFGAEVRLIDVQPYNPAQQAWSQEGRRQIYQSHNLR